MDDRMDGGCRGERKVDLAINRLIVSLVLNIPPSSLLPPATPPSLLSFSVMRVGTRWYVCECCTFQSLYAPAPHVACDTS